MSGSISRHLFPIFCLTNKETLATALFINWQFTLKRKKRHVRAGGHPEV